MRRIIFQVDNLLLGTSSSKLCAHNLNEKLLSRQYNRVDETFLLKLFVNSVVVWVKKDSQKNSCKLQISDKKWLAISDVAKNFCADYSAVFCKILARKSLYSARTHISSNWVVKKEVETQVIDACLQNKAIKPLVKFQFLWK